MTIASTTTDILSSINKLPTDVYGLEFLPSVEPRISDDADWFREPSPLPAVHFSKLDHTALEYAYNKLSSPPKLIVEIGVDACGGDTSTSTLLRLKPEDCMYVGIDVNPKTYLNSLQNNIFTIQTDSANHEELYKLMDWYGHEQIDFMFVDGWHSVNQVIKEWKYWEKMSPNGVMAFHDTNHHPGPVALFEAIDRNIFSVELFGREEADWGVGVVQRLKV